MQVFTPGAAARHTGSKYLGVLVAAKYARQLNELRRGELVEDDPMIADTPREKMTTTALGLVTAGNVEYQLSDRRNPGG